MNRIAPTRKPRVATRGIRGTSGWNAMQAHIDRASKHVRRWNYQRSNHFIDLAFEEGERLLAQDFSWGARGFLRRELGRLHLFYGRNLVAHAEEYPESHGIWFQRSEVRLAHFAAMPHFEQAIELRPRWSKPHEELGVSMLTLALGFGERLNNTAVSQAALNVLATAGRYGELNPHTQEMESTAQERVR